MMDNNEIMKTIVTAIGVELVSRGSIEDIRMIKALNITKCLYYMEILITIIPSPDKIISQRLSTKTVKIVSKLLSSLSTETILFADDLLYVEKSNGTYIEFRGPWERTISSTRVLPEDRSCEWYRT